MASSSNRKSSSSASSASKPTFRRASGRQARAPRPSARPARKPAAPAPAPARKPIGSYSASPKKPTLAPRPKPSAPRRQPSLVKQGATRKRVQKRAVPAASAPAAARPAATPQRAASPRRIITPAAARPKAAARVSVEAAGGATRPGVSLPAKLALGGVVAVIVLALAFILVVNSSIFAASNIQVQGTEHISHATVEQLIDVPEGTTLLNVDTDAITASLSSNPWVKSVSVERQFPNTLIITPVEWDVSAYAYITASDIAWAISSENTWISPVSLSVTADGDGNVIADGTAPLTVDPAQQVQQLSGKDAALALAHRDGAILFTDVAADVGPSSGKKVTSDVILAGLEYAKGFSADFIAQVKDMSLESEEAISVNLVSGVEVLLGEPDDIQRKERVVTQLLAQEEGVTYINVRTPDSYTFRSAPAT